MPEPSSNLIRVSYFVYRSPNVTEDEFHEYLRTTYASTVSKWLRSHGALTYRQIYTPSACNALLKRIPSWHPGKVTDFDGCIEILVRDPNALENALQDPYYHTVVKKDEDHYMDMERCYISIGWEEVHIDHGKVLGLPTVAE